MPAPPQTSGLEIEPLSEVGRDEALLGASEIIITIILAPIAKAAAKAVITTAFTFLQDYFAERVAMKDADLNVQLVVKESTAPGAKRFPFSLRQTTSQTINAFFENVKKDVLNSW